MFVGPIFARELLTTPRRPAHFVIRAAIVGLFFVLMWTAWQAVVGFAQAPKLGDMARFNSILFQLLSLTQILLATFTAGLYGTSSISHEKDRRTFILLLVTRLKDGEIVLDKFLCGMLQVGSVLLLMLPVFTLSALLGGVSFGQIGGVFAVTLGAALLSNAIGVIVAAWRDKTYQSVAMTMLAVTLVLLAVEALVGLAGGRAVLGIPAETLAEILSPLRATMAVVNGTSARVTVGGFSVSTALVHLALVGSFALGLLITATLMLRIWNPRGEPIQVPEADEGDEARRIERAKRQAAGLAPELHPETPASPVKSGRRDPFRKVWENCVLWREVATRAYGTKAILIKLAYYVIVALLTGAVILSLPNRSGESSAASGTVAGTTAVLCVLSLLLINAQSVTAITSERDIKSLDLLLVTDIKPTEFVLGKLGGILLNTIEMVLTPVVFLWAWHAAGIVPTLDAVYTTLAWGVWVAWAAVLGIHLGLRYESTKVSLANSMGTMFLLFVGIFVCLFLVLVSGRFDFQWGSFILFIVLGSIGLWISLSANAPSNAIGLAASLMPISTFYCLIAFVVGDRTAPFLVGAGVYGFAVAALLVPLLAEFDVATGRTAGD